MHEYLFESNDGIVLFWSCFVDLTVEFQYESSKFSDSQNLPKGAFTKFTQEFKIADASTPTEPGVAIAVSLEWYYDHVLPTPASHEE